jgi:MoaA/NifB/PqqE/SkfB family radical SAM enzyme
MSLLSRMLSSRESALFNPDTERMATPVPKTLWIELTSKCPFKCVFCTREVRWGNGKNLDFDIYRTLIGQLEEPEFIGLNYSGESIHYPRLMEAIELACDTGAYTELVTALSSAPEALVRKIVESRLDRLAVSLHTLDEKQYKEIYGFSSLQALKQQIENITALKRKLNKKTPKLDFCFVAMSHNLHQLAAVARYATEAGAEEIFIHPIIGRHPIPWDFSRELHSNKLTIPFKDALREAIRETRTALPQLPITVLNPDLDLNPTLQTTPLYYAPPLPDGGRIHVCDQSPFESVHVLANGDVVVCEVHDEVALGNLHSAGIREIWNGERYREFRRQYVTGENPGCRNCVWKTAYKPEPWKSRIHASEGYSPQLTRGWWVDPGADVIWSKKRSIAQFLPSRRTRQVRIAGMLPHDPVSGCNTLQVSFEGNVIASITNTTAGFLTFDHVAPIRTAENSAVTLELDVLHVFRPSTHSDSPDCRDLGFALQLLELQ